MHRCARLLAVIGLFAVTVPCLTARADDAKRTHDITVDDYFTLSVLSSPAVSPNGEHVVYCETRWNPPEDGRNTDLWISGTGMLVNQVRRLTFDVAVDASPKWSRDGRHIYFMSNRKRAEEKKPPYNGKMQVWRLSIDGGEPQAVTFEKDGVDAFELSHDGKTLYFSVTVENDDDEWSDLKSRYSELDYGHGTADHSQIWTLDLTLWRSEKLIDEKRTIGEFAVSPDGSKIAMLTTPDAHLISNEGWSRVDIFDAATKTVSTVADELWRQNVPSPHGWLEELAWSADSKALAFSCSWDGYASEIYVAEFTSESPNVWMLKQPDSAANGGGLHLKWRGTGRSLCFVAEHHARGYVYEIADVAGGKQGATQNCMLEDYVASDYDISPDGKTIVAIVGTTEHTPDLYKIMPMGDKSGAMVRLTNANPQVDTWKLPQISIVKWKAPDGATVEGVLELPHDYKPGDKPLPMILELHGGPTASTQMNLRYWIYGKTLLPSLGYAVLSPNYRGSTGYGRKFMVDLVGRENDIEVKDILAGVDALVEKGVADPERLGVMGWSNGGFLTNCLITTTTRFKAASSGAGVLDQFLQWGEEDTPGHVINYMRGLPWEKPDAYREGSPSAKLGSVTTPTIIHVGENDSRVPVGHSRSLYRGLKYYVKVPTELIVYPGEGHGLTTYKHRKAKMEWDVAWFKKYVLGESDEDSTTKDDAEKSSDK